MSSRWFLIAVILLTLACLALFAFWPELDLQVARKFFAAGKFTGLTTSGEVWRKIFYWAPYVVLAGFLLAYLARRLGWRRSGPDGRAVLFLVLSLALGPGLAVNAVLKEISHRPRPVQTQEFGGPWSFRPPYKFDGDCKKNCSFVSGEVAAAAWTLAPALLAAPPVRLWAIGASLLFTVAVGALRMSFGGHYLSDAALAALITFVIVLALYRLYAGAASPARAQGKRRES
jgi:membrane-associated phospholipid phosphatase